MTGEADIPVIDAAPLYAGRASAETSGALEDACREVGFFAVEAPQVAALLSPERWARLLSVFDADPAALRRVTLRRFAPENANAYRGYFPPVSGHRNHKEGYDVGAGDVAACGALPADHPFLEPNVWPGEAAAPGWRAAMQDYFAEAARLGELLMRALAPGLGVSAARIDALFDGGPSTLRVLRYPPRRPASFGVVTAPHVDSGGLTILWPDPEGGLQIRVRDGTWADVPAAPGRFVVNLGAVLAAWSGGRFRATEHRVLGGDRTRASIPYFHEPRLDAPALTLCGESETYGAHLARSLKAFVEFDGVAAE